MIIYSRQYIVSCIMGYINEYTLPNMGKKFRYMGNDFPSNLAEPSKSLLQGQFYIDDNNNIYLFYIFDPNTMWSDTDNVLSYYNGLDELLHKKFDKSLLNGLHLEIIFDETSKRETHNIDNRCRVEQTSRYLYDDTQLLWKDMNGKWKFIRDNKMLMHDKMSVYVATDKKNFKDYRLEVDEINSRYNFSTDNDSLVDAFNEYDIVYNNYFGKHLKIIDNTTEVTKFFAVNYTDYTIFK